MSLTKRAMGIDGWGGGEVNHRGEVTVCGPTGAPRVARVELPDPPSAAIRLYRTPIGRVYPEVQKPAALGFGEMMKRLRVRRGWSEKECARRARVAVQTIVRMESQDTPDRMQRTTLYQIGNNAYGYSRWQLELLWQICRSDPATRRLLTSAAGAFSAQVLQAALNELRECGALR